MGEDLDEVLAVSYVTFAVEEVRGSVVDVILGLYASVRSPFLWIAQPLVAEEASSKDLQDHSLAQKASPAREP